MCILLAAKSFNFCWKKAKQNFYQVVNSVLGRLGSRTQESVLLHIVNSQAVPHLLYGISSISLPTSDINSLSYAYNGIFAKLFNISNNTLIRSSQFYSGFLSLNLLYDYHRLVFLKKLFCTRVIKHGNQLDLLDITEYEALKLKYGVTDFDSKVVIKNKVWESFNKLMSE